MTIAELRDLCLSLPGTSYDFPFDEETIVFRVGGKMFGLAGINENPVSVNLKCDPILARDLRAGYEGIEPGYHMNKEHWNTVRCGSDVPDEQLEWLVRHSYDLVVEKLPKKRRPGVREQ
ncbi:MAG: MmcQ/YjbR family DNA-binding protein [Spirochaetota bacterium]